MLIERCIILRPETSSEFEQCKENFVPMMINSRSYTGYPCFKIDSNDEERFKEFLNKIEKG